MPINVNADNVTISNPIHFSLQDDSAAHVTLTVSITGQPPLTHSFTYGQGTFSGNLPELPEGSYLCAFTVQAFTYQALGSMCDSRLVINGIQAADAHGVVPAAGFDVGTHQFTLNVH